MSRSPFRPVRRRLHVRTGLFWPVTLVCAAAVALLTATVVQRAQESAAALGTMRSVPVAVRDLDVGEVIAADDVAWRDLPLVAVAPDAFDDDPTNETVVGAIVEGEVIMSSRLGRGGATGPLALIGTDERALVIPVHDVVPAFAPGARVDLLAGDRWVARDGIVIETAEQTVTVAVAEDDAPDVAVAILEGTISLALVSAR